MNGFIELADRFEKENSDLTAANIRKKCEIGRRKGIRFQYEGAVWTPIHSLEQCQELVEEVGMDNFGLVIDFWASRGGNPEDVATLDENMIYGVHAADGFRPEAGEDWLMKPLKG